MRRSITSDNGSEFSTRELHRLKTLGMEVYYCHASSAYETGAYERGAVEQANGELRQYFLKKTDFGSVTHEHLKEAERKLNARPMKIFGFKSARSIYESALNKATLQDTILGDEELGGEDELTA